MTTGVTVVASSDATQVRSARSPIADASMSMRSRGDNAERGGNPSAPAGTPAPGAPGTSGTGKDGSTGFASGVTNADGIPPGRRLLGVWADPGRFGGHSGPTRSARGRHAVIRFVYRPTSDGVDQED